MPSAECRVERTRATKQDVSSFCATDIFRTYFVPPSSFPVTILYVRARRLFSRFVDRYVYDGGICTTAIMLTAIMKHVKSASSVVGNGHWVSSDSLDSTAWNIASATVIFEGFRGSWNREYRHTKARGKEMKNGSACWKGRGMLIPFDTQTHFFSFFDKRKEEREESCEMPMTEQRTL